MNEARIEYYRMNPAEDRIVFGDELEEGMWVLIEDRLMRPHYSGSEEERLRSQRFCRVTRLRHIKGVGVDTVQFVGEWVDGYQEVRTYSASYGWLVKKDQEEVT